MTDLQLAAEIVNRLNEILEECPALGVAMERLRQLHADGPEWLKSDDCPVQASVLENGTACFGWLGLLNGIVGSVGVEDLAPGCESREGWGYISATIDEGDARSPRRIEKFELGAYVSLTDTHGYIDAAGRYVES